MTSVETSPPTPSPAPAASSGGAAGGPFALVRLARVKQWAKGVFVFVAPLYGGKLSSAEGWGAALIGFLAICLASSACYVYNDLRDVDADRAHPRKRRRPIASGAVSVPTARVFMGCLLLGALAALAGLWYAAGSTSAGWVAAACGLHVGNMLVYSARFKHIVILDVISLALGFVLRVLVGCAAVMVEPSPWLLNVTFFLAMFLAFGKRLGERRTMGDDASAARRVQASYTDELLRMVVVVTAVATLLTYAGWVQGLAERDASSLAPSLHPQSFTPAAHAALFWITMLPATFGVFRCMVLVERGDYDDPTELATRDRPFQAAALLFVLITVGLMWWGR
ncbi:MAG: UbiA family prenyltransferase [Phycisphaerales bacterium]